MLGIVLIHASLALRPAKLQRVKRARGFCALPTLNLFLADSQSPWLAELFHSAVDVTPLALNISDHHLEHHPGHSTVDTPENFLTLSPKQKSGLREDQKRKEESQHTVLFPRSLLSKSVNPTHVTAAPLSQAVYHGYRPPPTALCEW